MTPAEWEKSNDPQGMLRFLWESGRLSERKARLFAVACCRLLWPLLTDERSRKAVEAAEQFADGLLRGEKFDDIRVAAMAAESRASWSEERQYHAAALAAVETTGLMEDLLEVADCPVWAAEEAEPGDGWEEAGFKARKLLCDLLRDLFDPFKRITLGPPCFSPAVVALGSTIYECRSFDRLPELAQALTDEGCTDAAMLAHLRSPGPHTRGCFALDAVLGKS
jgi:hypothetical protein